MQDTNIDIFLGQQGKSTDQCRHLFTLEAGPSVPLLKFTIMQQLLGQDIYITYSVFPTGLKIYFNRFIFLNLFPFLTEI